MDAKRVKQLKQQHQQLLSRALCDMFIAGKGSPGYDEAYGRYRKSAKLLATPFFSDRVVRSRITERYRNGDSAPNSR